MGDEMKHTSPDIENLKEDYHNILGCSTNLIEAIKERDKRIKDLELQIETISTPLSK
tara:strand:+ start:300 stop:470 length:171 start_codon:yes stop_codon:yes gene_type:complete